MNQPLRVTQMPRDRAELPRPNIRTTMGGGVAIFMESAELFPMLI